MVDSVVDTVVTARSTRRVALLALLAVGLAVVQTSKTIVP